MIWLFSAAPAAETRQGFPLPGLTPGGRGTEVPGQLPASIRSPGDPPGREAATAAIAPLRRGTEVPGQLPASIRSPSHPPGREAATAAIAPLRRGTEVPGQLPASIRSPSHPPGREAAMAAIARRLTNGYPQRPPLADFPARTPFPIPCRTSNRPVGGGLRPAPPQGSRNDRPPLVPAANPHPHPQLSILNSHPRPRKEAPA